jgi:hypothetical protein
MYLSEEDFKKVFGVDKAAFSKYPAWKAKNLKQAKKLY